MHGIKKVLVITVPSGLGVWENEIAKHQPEGIKLQWKVINFEATYKRKYGEDRSWFAVPRKDLEKWNADLVIVDESHHIGNPGTVQSKFTYRLGKRARYRLIMTGTMFHRKPFYVFGQAKFYDEGVFGTNFGQYKKRIAVFGGIGNYEVLSYRNLEWMVKKVKPWVYMEDYVPPGDAVINVLPFHLTGRNLSAYASMEDEAVVKVGDEVVTAPIILTRHLRCQQIAGGWIKTESGSYRRVGRDKVNLVQDRFREYAEQNITKVVVGCRFIPELHDVAQAARKAGFKVILFHGGIPKGQARDRRIAAFNDTTHPCMFISQIATGKESIDLSAADTMMFYSISPSYVEHDQFSRRIEKYQDTRTLQYDFPVARGTRDEVSFLAMKAKADVVRLIAKRPDLVEQITRKERR